MFKALTRPFTSALKPLGDLFRPKVEIPDLGALQGPAQAQIQAQANTQQSAVRAPETEEERLRRMRGRKSLRIDIPQNSGSSGGGLSIPGV